MGEQSELKEQYGGKEAGENTLLKGQKSEVHFKTQLCRRLDDSGMKMLILKRVCM